MDDLTAELTQKDAPWQFIWQFAHGPLTFQSLSTEAPGFGIVGTQTPQKERAT